MAKRKVIKFVYQGHRCLKPQEWFEHDGKYEMWNDKLNSIVTYDVYHKIETEEEVPRWRAEYGGVFYRVSGYMKISPRGESYNDLDNDYYNSGNYFQTKEQAQEYLDHCKTFFENN